MRFKTRWFELCSHRNNLRPNPSTAYSRNQNDWKFQIGANLYGCSSCNLNFINTLDVCSNFKEFKKVHCFLGTLILTNRR